VVRNAVENGRADRWPASGRSHVWQAGERANFYSEGLSVLGDARAAGNASPSSMKRNLANLFDD